MGREHARTTGGRTEEKGTRGDRRLPFRAFRSQRHQSSDQIGHLGNPRPDYKVISDADIACAYTRCSLDYVTPRQAGADSPGSATGQGLDQLLPAGSLLSLRLASLLFRHRGILLSPADRPSA